MRNLWIFINKYSAFFLYIIFFTVSLILVFRKNPYQKAHILNSSEQVAAHMYERVNYLKGYLLLRQVNDSLLLENARLRNQLRSSFANDSVEQKTVMDSLTRQQYTYIVAQVVNNSVHQKNNFITINRGKKHGIAEGMGVISATGVVGFVRDVSENYARIQSLLHSDTKISASIAGTNAFGSLVWGEGNYNPQKAILLDIANQIVVKPGEKIVTSGLGVFFPAGIPVGEVLHTGVKRGNNFMDIDVKLNTDFASLQYVYVINNMRAAEQEQLEKHIKEND
jgi:rod shape-determining protein MreC